MESALNDQFQHVMVLISIIIGLAITHLLSGVVDAVDRATDEDAPEIFSPLGALWAGTVFFWMINFWWFQFRLLAMEDAWTLWRYLFIILYAVALYILAVTLVPRDWDAIKRYSEYFMRNRRWFFIALLLASIADVADAFLKGRLGLRREHGTVQQHRLAGHDSRRRVRDAVAQDPDADDHGGDLLRVLRHRGLRIHAGAGRALIRAWRCVKVG